MVIAFSTVLVPLLDVIRVVLHRLRNHRNPFLPDKNHFHHKLLRTGMRVRMGMGTLLCVSVFFIVLNVLLAMKVNATYLLLLNLVLWSILHDLLCKNTPYLFQLLLFMMPRYEAVDRQVKDRP